MDDDDDETSEEEECRTLRLEGSPRASKSPELRNIP